MFVVQCLVCSEDPRLMCSMRAGTVSPLATMMESRCVHFYLKHHKFGPVCELIYINVNTSHICHQIFFHAIIGKGLDQSLREHKDISGHFAKIWSYIQPPIPQFVQSVVLSFAPTSRVCQFEKVFKEMLSHLKIPASRVCLF